MVMDALATAIFVLGVLLAIVVSAAVGIVLIGAALRYFDARRP